MAASDAQGQDVVQPGETLDLKRCIAIALQRHPSIKSASGNLAASRSRITQARSAYYPQVGWSTEARRMRPAGGTSSTGGSAANYNQYTTQVDLNQTLFDFGRTPAQVGVRSLEAEAAQADLGNITDRIVFQVAQAYYGVLWAKQNLDAYAQTVGQFEQHLQSARKFFEVGVKSKIDVTKAEVDLSQARFNLLTAENALKIAGLTLKNALGVPEAPDFEVKDSPLPFTPVISQEQAMQRAFAQRLDLRSATARREAAERAFDLARTGYYPVLNGNAAYGWSGEEFPLDKEWTIGAGLSIPLFNGFQTRGQIDEARANLVSVRADEELVKQTVRFDIAQAYANLSNARQRLALTEVSLSQAMENRGLAEGRYAAGVGSALEVTDAVVSEVTAKTEAIGAQYDYQIALAGLAKAMGERFE
ncbi:MAG: TolC family protein [Syntrophaceae bacterium]